MYLVIGWAGGPSIVCTRCAEKVVDFFPTDGTEPTGGGDAVQETLF
jgi:hypothetical protein